MWGVYIWRENVYSLGVSVYSEFVDMGESACIFRERVYMGFIYTERVCVYIQRV